MQLKIIQWTTTTTHHRFAFLKIGAALHCNWPEAINKRRAFINVERSRRFSRKNKISQICQRFQIRPLTRGNRLNGRMSPNNWKAFNLLSRLEVNRNNYQKFTMIPWSASNSVAFSPTLHLFILFVASCTFPASENI